MLRWIFSFLMIFLTTQLGAASEIVVHLPVEKPLLPIYLCPATKDTSFDASYISKLEKVLYFDLENNGMTTLFPRSNELDQLAKPDDFNQFQNSPVWTKKHIAYVMKINVSSKALSARLFMTGSGVAKGIDHLPLTGNLSEDREQVHRLADLIHQTLFGEEGIASTKVLFTLRDGNPGGNGSNWKSDVWEMDYDGANPHKLTSNAYTVTPTYFPSKKGYKPSQFLFVSYKTGQPKIMIQSLRKETAYRMTKLRGNQMMPAISPKRDLVAFICDASGTPDLFLQAFDTKKGAVGKPKQLFRSPGGTQASPCFSPDGKKLCFVSNKDGSPRIYTMEIPEYYTHGVPQPTLLTKLNRENTAPVWSPDGTKIAFSARNSGPRQIWIYDFDTNREWQLTSGPGDKENPTWAPNSLHLMFSSTNSYSSDLYMVNLNQKKVLQITDGKGEKGFPEWEPREALR